MAFRRVLVAIACVLTALGSCAAGVHWYITRPPYAVAELPSEADDVHWLNRDLFPDWSLSVSATLAEQPCRGYVARAFPDLAPLDVSTLEQTLGEEASWGVNWGTAAWPGDERYDWWRPQAVDEHPTWYRNRGGAWELVQCSDGHVFYEDFSH
ncbi:MAG: hypothetical protein AAGE52_31225 [Myxococcota bacterium]